MYSLFALHFKNFVKMISRKNIYSLYSLIGWGCNSHNADQNGQNRAPGKRGALEFAHQLSQDFEPPKSKWEGYMKSALKQWEPAPGLFTFFVYFY